MYTFRKASSFFTLIAQKDICNIKLRFSPKCYHTLFRSNITELDEKMRRIYLRENKVLICQQGHRRRGERLNDNLTARQNNASDVRTCFLNLVHFLTDLCKTTFQNTN